MEIQDIHVGNQLHASSALGQLSPAITPAVRDPTCLGVGPLSIPGSIFANGLALVGSPLAYPSIPEANLMVARSNPLVNPKAAKVPSIFKVTSKFGIPATPLDVMLGDFGIGMVGITINSLSIAINNATICVLNSFEALCADAADADTSAVGPTDEPLIESASIPAKSPEVIVISPDIFAADAVICPLFLRIKFSLELDISVAVIPNPPI